MARDLKTEKLKAIAADLPQLTEKQSEFVAHLLSGKTASDAYRAAYNCEKAKAATIWAAASKLAHDSNVAPWLQAARTAGLDHSRETLDEHCAQLRRIREIAIESGNLGAATQAQQSLGKVNGHYVERHVELDRDPLQVLNEIAAVSPDLASQLAQQQGIKWETKH